MKESVDIALEASIQGYPDIAEDLLRARLIEQPDDLRVLFNLGWHDLRHGKFHDGMYGLSVGRMLNVFGSPALPGGKLWCGEDLKGKTLFFRCEGGLGDEIINIRFAKAFEEKGAKVIVGCNGGLAPWFAKNGHIAVAHEATEHTFYDYWVPAMSAPYMLNYEYEDLSGKPYLDAPKRNLYERPGTLKVGIRWSGNPQFEHEQHRRFDPKPLLDLHTIPGITLYSLQRDGDTVPFLPFGDLQDHMQTWENTASIVKSLDLVITSCTSVAHCAAAMGVETWVVVPALPYYVWALPGDKSPWYDSVCLFRQKRYGDWSEPMENIRAALEDRVGLKLAA